MPISEMGIAIDVTTAPSRFITHPTSIHESASLEISLE